MYIQLRESRWKHNSMVRWLICSPQFPNPKLNHCYSDNRVWAAAALKLLGDILSVENIGQHAKIAQYLNAQGLKTLDDRQYTKQMVKSKINNATGDLKAKILRLKNEKKLLGTHSEFHRPFDPFSLFLSFFSSELIPSQ